MSAPAPKAVFLSYASQDADAARRIAQALRAEGIEVWFDESALAGGEAWDASIRRQIRDCALFVAIVSANTQARKEGYFRLEWKLADERSHLIAEGTPFVLPVIIDGTKERDALVPKSFLGVQWTWLPHGEVPPAFVTRVQRLIYPAVERTTATKSTLAAEMSAEASAATSPPRARPESTETLTISPLAPAATTLRRTRSALWIFAAGFLTALSVVALIVAVRDGGLGAISGGGSRQAVGAGVTKLTITLPPGQAVRSRPAVSRDGRMIAYTAGTPTEEPRLYIHRLDELEPRPTRITTGTAVPHLASPFFSPDGRSIAYFANGRLFRWTIEGGAPVELAKDAPVPVGGTWGDDDTIVFGPMWNARLFRLPASGGTPVSLLRPDEKAEHAFTSPRFVPGRREVLFTATGKNGGVWRLDLETGERSLVFPQGHSGTLTTSGHLLMAREDPLNRVSPGLLAAVYRKGLPLDLAPPLVLPGINFVQGIPDLWSSVSDTGTLAYVPADIRAKSLVLVDLSGKVELFSSHQGAYQWVNVSRSTGRVIATADRQVWLFSPDGASRERVASENQDWEEAIARWTPDGRAIVYTLLKSGTWDVYRRILGDSKSEVLIDQSGEIAGLVMSSDGTVAYARSNPDADTGNDIWLRHADGKSQPWLVSRGNQFPNGFSRDGKWLAYHSEESGACQIYVKPVAGEAARIQISTAEARYSAWSPKDNTLFFLEAGAMWEVNLGSGDIPVPSPRRKLFEGGWALNPLSDSDFDVMPDGKHFLMIRNEPKALQDRIHVVVNWYDELRRLVPVK